MKIGDRVWHKTVKANGTIVELGTDIPYRVEFSWAKHCKTKGGRYRGFKWPERKWQWSSMDELSVQPVPEKKNKVTVVGGNFLDNLLRATCYFPRRQKDDGSDIILSYGIGNINITADILVLNRWLIINKYNQQQVLGDYLGIHSKPMLSVGDSPGDWIIKPYSSIGGKGIRPASYDLGCGGNEYFQRKFPKVREFRAHVFMWLDKPVALIQEKKIVNKDQLCWNAKQGSTFFSPHAPEHGWYKLNREDPGLLERISDLSIKALKAIKYDFGGIDIGMDAEGNLKIFEVNSRMGVKERSLRTYKRVMWELYSLDINKYKRERWSV